MKMCFKSRFNCIPYLIGLLLVLLSLSTSCRSQQLSAVTLSVPLPSPTYCNGIHYDGQDLIYLFGNCNNPQNRLLLFSVSSQTLQDLGPLPTPAFYGTAVGDAFDNIFYFTANMGPSSPVWKYVPATNTTSVVAQLDFSAAFHTSLKYNSTMVYILAGLNNNELYTFDLKNLTTSTRLATFLFRTLMPTSVLVGSKAYIFDGVRINNKQALELDLETLKMTQVGPATLPVIDSKASSVSGGENIYILGGYNASQGIRTDGLIQFDPATHENRFLPVSNLLNASNATYFSYAPSCVFVPRNNRIYCFGGKTWDGVVSRELDEILYIDLTPVQPPPTITEGPSSSSPGDYPDIIFLIWALTAARLIHG